MLKIFFEKMLQKNLTFSYLSDYLKFFLQYNIKHDIIRSVN